MDRHVCRSSEGGVLSAVGRLGEHVLGIATAACNEWLRPGFWSRSLLSLGEESEGGAFQFK